MEWSGVEWSGVEWSGVEQTWPVAGATAVGLHGPPLLLLGGSASVIAPQARFSSPKPRLTRGGQGGKQGTQSSKQHPRGRGGEDEREREKGGEEKPRERQRGRKGGRREGGGGGKGPQRVNQDAANRATARQADAQPNGPESTPWDSRATAPPPALADIH